MAKKAAEEKSAQPKSWAEVISAQDFVKQNFDGIAEAIIRAAERGQSSDKCSATEKSELAALTEIFMSSRDALMDHLESIQPEEQRRFLINNFTRFLLSVMGIGHFKLPSRKVREKVEQLRTRDWRAGKTAKNQPRAQRLEDYLKRRAAKEQLQDTDKYAGSIRSEIDFKPVIKDGWPSISTIRRFIRVILTERTSSRCQNEENSFYNSGLL